MGENTIRRIAIIIFVIATIATLTITVIEWWPYHKEMSQIEERVEDCSHGYSCDCDEYRTEIKLLYRPIVLLWMDAIQQIAWYAIGCALLAGVATIIKKLERMRINPA